MDFLFFHVIIHTSYPFQGKALDNLQFRKSTPQSMHGLGSTLSSRFQPSDRVSVDMPSPRTIRVFVYVHIWDTIRLAKELCQIVRVIIRSGRYRDIPIRQTTIHAERQTIVHLAIQINTDIVTVIVRILGQTQLVIISQRDGVACRFRSTVQTDIMIMRESATL